mmetsp:Transcript_25534/g.55597  ORF Transcript_25534/g.55597 Transcript_25534/m.55597 type:complete len:140 (-) Transcript_25534:1613-2032(-)
MFYMHTCMRACRKNQNACLMPGVHVSQSSDLPFLLHSRQQDHNASMGTRTMHLVTSSNWQHDSACATKQLFILPADHGKQHPHIHSLDFADQPGPYGLHEHVCTPSRSTSTACLCMEAPDPNTLMLCSRWSGPSCLFTP